MEPMEVSRMPKKRYQIGKWRGVYGYDSTTRRVNGRSDICYYINFRMDGRLKWEKIGWKSEGYSPQLAAEIRAKRVRDTRHGKTVKTAQEIRTEKHLHDRPLVEIKDAYFSNERGLNLKGRRTDLNRWDNHLATLSQKRVSSLSQLDIERIKHDMKGKAPATIGNTLELLRRLINFGVKHNLCPALPFTIKLPRKNNELTEYLKDEEVRRLMEVLENWPRQDVSRMVKLAWLTGMRRGEIFKLQLSHIDFEQCIITLVNPKGGRNEAIPMSEPVHDLLKEQVLWTAERYPDSPFLFPGKAGRQRVDCSSVERIKKAAGLPKSFRPFHGLRHHMAVMLASSGEYTLDMIGELLTHKSTAITRRYAKFLPDAKKKAADRAAELLTGQTAKADVVDIASKKAGED
jgi:integrase